MPNKEPAWLPYYFMGPDHLLDSAQSLAAAIVGSGRDMFHRGEGRVPAGCGPNQSRVRGGDKGVVFMHPPFGLTPRWWMGLGLPLHMHFLLLV